MVYIDYGMDMTSLQDTIKQELLQRGAAMVGFAEITDIPISLRESFPQAIAIACAVNPDIIHQIHSGPTPSYQEEYDRINTALWDMAVYVSKRLKDHHIDGKALKATQAEDEYDRVTLSVPLPHKAVALRAGLGWIGKSDLLITRQYGPAVRLNTVLHNANFKTAEPVTQSHCGDCQACVTACPARAMTGRNWTIDKKREDLYNAFACCAKARELADQVGIPSTICGICIHVCPWTQQYLNHM